MARQHNWLRTLDYVERPPRRVVRPVSLGALGSESSFIEPFEISSPNRVYIGERVTIEEGARIWVATCRNASAPKAAVHIDNDTTASIDLFVYATSYIEIGAGVRIGPRVFIGDPIHGHEGLPALDPDLEESAPIHIGDGVVVGAGAMIFSGVSIGERAFVPPGSVVAKDMPALAKKT